MSDTENAVPAGASEPQALSLSAAAEQLDALDQASSAPAEESNEPEPEAAVPEVEAEAETGEEAQEGEPEPTNDEGEQPLEFERLHGNTKIRLRDGTEWTVGEMKRRLDDLRQVDRSRDEFANERTQFQQRAAQFAQTAQFIEQAAPRAIAALQAQLPEIPDLPDVSMRQTDPFGYSAAVDDRNRAIDAYNARVAEIQQIEQAQQVAAQQADQQRHQMMEHYLQNERQQLVSAMPDLRDDAKRAEVWTQIQEHGKAYGFNEQDLAGIYDHRMVKMMRDAINWRTLQASKPKPVPKAAQRPSVPVAQPGKRLSAPEAKAAQTDELRRQANKAGGLSMMDAARLLDQLEEG